MCTADIVRSNQARCEDILECKRQIQYWKAKLEGLEEEQELHIKLARLRLDAVCTWRALSRKERLEKEFILAALESPELPAVLEDFPNSAFPAHIRLDREILLARVARDDFAKKYADERMFVPPRLRGDKFVILQIIPKHPQVIECMSCELRDDQDIFDAVIRNKSLPTHFLQHFSDRIRSSRRMMRRLLSHKEGLSSLAFCSQELRNDKDFILDIVERGNHSVETQVLRYTSQQLRADEDVVYAAVCKSGMNLKHASYPLRRDERIVRAAAKQNGVSFKYCLPSAVKDDLLKDRTFVLGVVATHTPNMIMKSCTGIHHMDREILIQGLSSGLDWSAIPDTLQEDKDFVLKALTVNSQLYLDLPEEMRESFDVALHVVKLDKVLDDVILEATERCPDLLSSREAITAIAKNWETDVLQETLQFSPLEIRGDKELMMEAVKNDSIAFEYCSDELQHDRDIVFAAINNSPNSLYLIMDAFQLENPDIVIAAIEKTERGDLWTTYDDVYDELWANRDVAKAWLAQGGDWLSDDFPEEFEDDEDLFLTVVQKNWEEFDFASERLKNDKDFVLRALSFDGRIIRDVAEDLRYDFDVAMAAFRHSCPSLQFYSGPEDFPFMVSLTQHVRAKLEDFDFFNDEIIDGIRCPQGDKCVLSMLNQGPYTTHMYTNLIGSFLGLPEGDELLKLQETSKNLLAWGY